MTGKDAPQVRPFETRLQVATWLWCAAIVMTAVLLSRRVSGELSPTSAAPAILVSLFVASLCLVAWAFFQSVQRWAFDTRAELLVALVSWAPAWLAGFAVCPTNSSFGHGWLVSVAILVAVALGTTGRWSAFRRHVAVVPEVVPASVTNHTGAASRGTSAIRVESESRVESEPMDARHKDDSTLSVFDPALDMESDGIVTHRMTRQIMPDGVEQLSGAVRVSFAAGQRAVSVHVPFSPPFSSVPEVECETSADEEVRWKVAVVYAYGMRVDLKRSDCQQPAEIELAYAALSDAACLDAA